MPRQIIIGDIHGCLDELQELLDRVAPAADDRIIAIGDLVDRGGNSEAVLEFFRDTPNAVSLMGNHERKHIRAAQGAVRPALSQRIVRAELGERYADWVAFMQSFVRHIELPEAVLVHGFLEPGVPLERQRDGVVIGTLSGEAYIREKYGDPWYEQVDSAKPVVFGHHDYLRSGAPLIDEGRYYGIDTGAVYGGRLTALVLPEFTIVQVPAHADHWANIRRRFAALADSGGSENESELGP